MEESIVKNWRKKCAGIKAEYYILECNLTLPATLSFSLLKLSFQEILDPRSPSPLSLPE